MLLAEGGDSFGYLSDHLGSPVRLTDGDVMTYDEFGVPGGMIDPEKQPFGFTGYQTDNVSRLYYAQARYYQPETGGFVSEDAVYDGANWYGYCDCNPLRFIDPSGLYDRQAAVDYVIDWHDKFNTD